MPYCAGKQCIFFYTGTIGGIVSLFLASVFPPGSLILPLPFSLSLSLSLSLQIRALHNNEQLPNLLFGINLKKAKMLSVLTELSF